MLLIVPTLLLLGDSITNYSYEFEGGWGKMLSEHFQSRCVIEKWGYSGYTSRDWLKLANDLPLKGEIATLWLGANDACDDPKYYVPIEDYKKNLITIVNSLKLSKGIEDIIVLSPPPVNKNRCRTNEVTEQYSKACVETAKSLGLTYIDVYSAFKQQVNWESLLTDGLHLSQKGSKVVFELLKTEIEKKLEQNISRKDKSGTNWSMFIFLSFSVVFGCFMQLYNRFIFNFVRKVITYVNNKKLTRQ